MSYLAYKDWLRSMKKDELDREIEVLMTKVRTAPTERSKRAWTKMRDLCSAEIRKGRGRRG